MVSASFSAFNTVAVQEILAVLGAGILTLAPLQGSFNPSLGLGYTPDSALPAAESRLQDLS